MVPMSSFDTVYDRLNDKQRAAVDAIDGPLLVIAGPGTGKTQLLSARVANILRKTDVSPKNILCLTFTESGAANMRERLRGMIGDDAYDVTISTYHSFGSDIIKNYSEHFQTIATDRSDDIRLERPIDELSRIQIIEKIVNKLPFDSPMLSARYYIKSVVSTISDLKQHLLTPDALRQIAQSNLEQIAEIQPLLDEIINKAGGISRQKNEKAAQYDQLLDAFRHASKRDLIVQALAELESAHQKAAETESPTPLTKWKDAWLYKNEQDQFVFTDPARSEKMADLAYVYEAYQAALKKTAAYDFDDMILQAIQGLSNNDGLRFNLQERYQYILLDEFQDTNPSQFELVRRVADHPVHEGRPNIMAVGDDDQAIFAFQGANVGNMQEFLTTFREVAVINLVENYRSHSDILHVAHGIANQIDNRLHTQLDSIDKVLIASSKTLPTDATVSRHEFAAEASEYAWIAAKIAALVSAGERPSEIAVLAPKHALLENMVPFLKQQDVPVAYEKRENILETEIVQGLRLAAQLLAALSDLNMALADQYFPLVLSLPYWNIAAQDIWQVNWQRAKADETRRWAEIALDSPKLAYAVTFYLELANSLSTDPLEITLDKLIGSVAVAGRYAPLKTYYFASGKRSTDALKYYEAISHLSVIRSRLREYQAANDHQLRLQDFLEFFDLYEAAEATLINSHPIAQSNDAVQLMTAYKSKGLEFNHVFILQAHDDIWGSASTGGNNKLTLPQNLAHIRYTNSTNDERLRVFFVAVTRARHGLFITSHTTKDNGRKTTPLKYLAEAEGISTRLPSHSQTIISEPLHPVNLAEDIEALWQAGQISLPADFRNLLTDRLQSYRMSPTHLNTFMDLEHGGPEAFLIQTLLKFPQAPSASGEYGTAMHNTLEWYQNKRSQGELPSHAQVLKQYDIQLAQRYMTDIDREHARGKGGLSLQKYLTIRKDMFERPAKAEVNFYNEGVLLGEAHLSGKIDRLEIDETHKSVRIVDYKTGAPLKKWGGSTKALKYLQQLYFYKFLIEGSATWQGYTVTEARLEFIEAEKNGTGDIMPALQVAFDPAVEANMKQLIQVVWNHIQTLTLPDVDGYSKDLRGTQAFEKTLLSDS